MITRWNAHIQLHSPCSSSIVNENSNFFCASIFRPSLLSSRLACLWRTGCAFASGCFPCLFDIIEMRDANLAVVSENRCNFFFCSLCSGKIIKVEVVDGGMICSSGVYLEAMGDQNEDCYIVNAAVYVGY